MIKILICFVWNVPGGGLNYGHNFCDITKFDEANLQNLKEVLAESLEKEARKQACLNMENPSTVNLVFTSITRLDG